MSSTETQPVRVTGYETLEPKIYYGEHDEPYPQGSFWAQVEIYGTPLQASWPHARIIANAASKEEAVSAAVRAWNEAFGADLRAEADFWAAEAGRLYDAADGPLTAAGIETQEDDPELHEARDIKARVRRLAAEAERLRGEVARLSKMLEVAGHSLDASAEMFDRLGSSSLADSARVSAEQMRAALTPSPVCGEDSRTEP